MLGHVLQKYKIRPLESWGKAKELRYNFFRDFVTAQERGKYISLGSTSWLDSLLAGIGDVLHLGGKIYRATVGLDPALARACNEAVEAREYSRDLCALTRGCWSSVFLNRYYFGDPSPRHICNSHAWLFQIVAKYFNVPYFSIDWAIGK